MKAAKEVTIGMPMGSCFIVMRCVVSNRELTISGVAHSGVAESSKSASERHRRPKCGDSQRV